MARNTLRGFIGICELKILDQDKFNTVVSTERECSGKLSVKEIEQHCRVAQSEYTAQSKWFKEEGRRLPFFPKGSLLRGKIKLHKVPITGNDRNIDKVSVQFDIP